MGTSETLLIGILGKARAGKDTFAWALIDALRPQGIDARRYGFADALKAILRGEYGMTTKDSRLAQDVGTAYREGYRRSHFLCDGTVVCEPEHQPNPTPDVWLDITLATIAEDAPRVAILSDVRFPNEAAAITGRGGFLVRVERPERPASGRDDSHVSETALDGHPVAWTVANTGTRRDLRAEAERLARWVVAEVDR